VQTALTALHPKVADEVVAKVNEQPIYARCVATQAKAHSLGAQEALEECISFALLAQEAQREALLAHPKVQRIGKEEMVRHFVEARYPIASAADLPMPLVKRLWDRVNVPRYNHPELRDIVFCRISMPRGKGPKSTEFKTAYTFLQGIYERFAERRDLEENDLFKPCYEEYKEAGIAEIKLRTFDLNPPERYAKSFRPTVFNVPAAGMLAPPLFTRFGLDLILVTRVIPPKKTSFEEAEDELRTVLFEKPVFEDERAEEFLKWYKPLEQKHVIAVFPNALPSSHTQSGASIPQNAP